MLIKENCLELIGSWVENRNGFHLWGYRIYHFEDFDLHQTIQNPLVLKVTDKHLPTRYIILVHARIQVGINKGSYLHS